MSSLVVPRNIAALRVNANDNNLVVSNFKGRTAVFENIPYQVGATGASTSDSIVRPIESNSSASRMNFP